MRPLRALHLRDANGCEQTLSHTLVALPKPLAAFQFDPLFPVENVDEVRFNENCLGNDLVAYQWSVGGLPEPLSLDQRRFYYLFEEAGTYPVALTVKNAAGCSDTAVKMLTVAPDFAFYIPNVFTPDGDGKNDVFIPVFRGTQVFKMQIFDRWGQLIFSCDQFGKGWDGSFRGSACQQDEYTWTLVLTTSAGIEKKFTGNVLLYR